MVMIGNFVAYEAIQNISIKNRVFQMSTHRITCNAMINYQILLRYSCHSESKASRRLRGKTTIDTSQLRIIFVVFSYVSINVPYLCRKPLSLFGISKGFSRKSSTTSQYLPYSAIFNFRVKRISVTRR